MQLGVSYSDKSPTVVFCDIRTLMHEPKNLPFSLMQEYYDDMNIMLMLCTGWTLLSTIPVLAKLMCVLISVIGYWNRYALHWMHAKLVLHIRYI